MRVRIRRFGGLSHPLVRPFRRSSPSVCRGSPGRRTSPDPPPSDSLRRYTAAPAIPPGGAKLRGFPLSRLFKESAPFQLFKRLAQLVCVFITIGPYHATGSSSGLPETSRKRMPSRPPAPSLRRRCRTAPANGCPPPWAASFQPAHPSVGTASGPGRVAELARSRRTRRRRHDASSRPAVSSAARRHRHIQIHRIGRDPIHRALLAPEIPADHAHVRSVVVGDLGNLRRPSLPDSAARSSSATRAGWPTVGSRACGPPASPLGISWWMMPLPAVIHWTSPAAMAPRLPMLSPCSTVPAST